jgi:hypothetical protein
VLRTRSFHFALGIESLQKFVEHEPLRRVHECAFAVLALESKAMDLRLAWAIENMVELVHIQRGKPTQNVYVESFHGKLREECLRVSWFQNLFDATRKISAWRHDYNHQWPPSSLNYRTPAEFAAETGYAKSGKR